VLFRSVPKPVEPLKLAQLVSELLRVENGNGK